MKLGKILRVQSKKRPCSSFFSISFLSISAEQLKLSYSIFYQYARLECNLSLLMRKINDINERISETLNGQPTHFEEMR